jgi:serine protease inhibitor
MRFRVILCTALLASCAEPITGPPALRESLPRPLSAMEAQLIEASNVFAFDLFNAIAENPANAFISPLSVSVALGMTMNGAEGETLDSMRSVLGFAALDLADINASYRSLIALLRDVDHSTTFRLGNSVWFRNTFAINPAFTATVEDAFDARVGGLDFSSAEAVSTINDWASDATNGRIDQVIESIDDATMLLLLNAIYFNGAWRSRFDAGATVNRPFTTSSGAVQSVATMAQKVNARYVVRPFAQVVDLPYGNGAFTMTLLLPSGALSADSLARTLSSSAWHDITDQLGASPPQDVELRLPKFEFSGRRVLNAELIGLGMGPAFCPGCAEFGRMSTDSSALQIDFVQHDTYVRVHEAGTEAAAVTTVGVGITSAPMTPQFFVDRPFIFVIRERLSGTILFIGKMNSIPGS